MRFILRCLAYFKGEIPRILWSLALIFLATVVALLQPFPLAILIDSVFVERPSNAWQHRLFLSLVPEGKLGQIFGLAGITLGLTILGGILTMLQTMAAVTVGYRGLMHVRCDLFKKLQQLSLSYHRSQPQGDSIYRLSYDTFGFQTMLNIFVSNVLVSFVTLAVMTWIMFAMNWKLALISLAIVPLLAWTHQWSQKLLQSGWAHSKDVDMRLTTQIQRSIASMWLTQAFGRERDEFGRFHTAADRAVSAMLSVHWREVIYGLAIATILGLGTALIFGYGGYVVYQDQFVRNAGEAGMTVGKLYIFITYLSKFYEPLNKLTGSGAGMAQSAVAAQRVFDVLDREPTIQDAPGAISLPREPRTLEIRDARFEYAGGKMVLDGISAKVSPGEMVAFVGSSGVGKSTLLNLLPRFYDVTGGAILLDGHDLRQIKMVDLRKHVALVLQENPLLPATVAENIAYGRPEAGDDVIRKYATMAGADEFIARLPEGYHTILSENATNLSGGQRQRIAIARALITEAPLMILDEPTSALDPKNEQMITETLGGLKRQRTIIIVSHRLSTVADCDRIYVMDAGKIIEQGTHDALIAARGKYYEMAKHQMKLEDDDEVLPAGLAPASELPPQLSAT